MPRILVGNSLSFCIRAVSEGEVPSADVAVIRCSFPAPPDEKSFIDGTLEHYAQIYWRKEPLKAKAIALAYYREGRLIFTGGHFLPADGTWGNIYLTLSGKTVTDEEKTVLSPVDLAAFEHSLAMKTVVVPSPISPPGNDAG